MLKIITALAAAVTVVACGGGGGDAPVGLTPEALGGAAAPAFPLETAYKAYMATPNIYSYSLSGTCGGFGTETTSPPVPGTFEGAPVQVKTSSIQITRESCSAWGPVFLETGTDTIVGQTFFDANFRPLGASVPGVSYTILTDGAATLPSTVKVGDAAILASGTSWASSLKGTAIGGESISFAVEADTETSVLVKLIDLSNTNGVQVTQTSTYRLTSAGALTLLRHEIFAGGAEFVLTPK